MTIDATDAARELFTAHAADLHAYAARRVGRDVAQDVVAETFRQVIESWDTFDSERGSRRGWLFGIATNVMRRHWRTERRRIETLARAVGRELRSSSDDQLSGVDARIDADGEAIGVLEVVAELSPQDRELLTLVAWEEMAHRDVADILNIPAGTVRSRLHRIRRQLDRARSTTSTAPANTSKKGNSHELDR